MSNSRWHVLKNWFFRTIADLIPEASRRFVLYDLNDRVNLKRSEDAREFWGVTTEDMYNELKD